MYKILIRHKCFENCYRENYFDEYGKSEFKSRISAERQINKSKKTDEIMKELNNEYIIKNIDRRKLENKYMFH